MCNSVQRTRCFFGVDAPEWSLPSTDIRQLPERAKSLSNGGRLTQPTSLIKGSSSTLDLPGWANGGVNNPQRYCIPGVTVASVVSCLLLAPLLGALVYQRKLALTSMDQIKNEIALHLHQISEMKEYTQASLGKISLYGDLDKERQLYFLEENRKTMQLNIQLLSERMLREKYGPGPKYRVEMRILMDPMPNPDIVMIETASREDMPHSVFHFLELVSHGVYDGMPFHRNANHIVQAGPSDVQLHLPKTSPLNQDPSLGNVVFQEYSPEMPHLKYTLGFGGRPGGPDFYINMQDNSKLHGPGGQAWHYGDVADDADPCFARVIQGQEIIDRIHQSPTASGDKLIESIIIHEMRILHGAHVVSERDQPANAKSTLRSNR